MVWGVAPQKILNYLIKKGSFYSGIIIYMHAYFIVIFYRSSIIHLIQITNLIMRIYLMTNYIMY